MASSDIIPCSGTWDLENKKFAKNSKDKICIRTCDDDVLEALGGGPGGTQLRKTNSLTPVGTTTDTDTLIIDLSVNTTYTVLYSEISNFRDSFHRLVFDDDGALENLAQSITGSGDFKWQMNKPNIKFTTGATGTQRIIMRSQQLNGNASPFRGTLVVLENS